MDVDVLAVSELLERAVSARAAALKVLFLHRVGEGANAGGGELSESEYEAFAEEVRPGEVVSAGVGGGKEELGRVLRARV